MQATAETAQLDILCKSKAVKTLPDVVQEKVQATLSKMNDAVANCKSVLSKGAELDITSSEAIALAKQSLLQRNFIEKLIETNIVKGMP